MLRVIRPHIVIGGILGYTLGVFYSSMKAQIDLRVVLLGYFGMAFIDLSTHYSNDYYDIERDKEANWKPFGSKNVLIREPELAPWLFRIALACSGLSLVFASCLVFRFRIHWLLLVLVVVGNILGWSYSNSFIQLKGIGLGETVIAVGTGFIIPAIGYMVVTGFLSRDFVYFAAPLVIYGFVLSVFLEIPDLEVDRRNNINNLAVRYGSENITKACLGLSALNTIYYLLGCVPFLNKTHLILVSLFPLIGCSIAVLRRADSRKAIETNTFLVVSGLFTYIIGLNISLIYYR